MSARAFFPSSDEVISGDAATYAVLLSVGGGTLGVAQQTVVPAAAGALYLARQAFVSLALLGARVAWRVPAAGGRPGRATRVRRGRQGARGRLPQPAWGCCRAGAGCRGAEA